ALRLFSFASASIWSVISRPYALPVGPTRFAESRTSTPPPEPRSTTTSPAFSFANAVGFPHPKEASMASSGTCPAWEESYRLEVIGSQPNPRAAVAPQQLLPPVFTRKAAWPYFSFTTFLISVLLTVASLLFTNLDDILRIDRFVSSTTFGIEELQKLLEGLRVCRVAQKGTFAAYVHKTFVFQFLQVVRKRGVRNVER